MFVVRAGLPGADWPAACAVRGLPSADWPVACAVRGLPGADWPVACAVRGLPGADWPVACAVRGLPGADWPVARRVSGTLALRRAVAVQSGDNKRAHGDADGPLLAALFVPTDARTRDPPDPPAW